MILSGNRIEHGLLALAAMYVGSRTHRLRRPIRCSRREYTTLRRCGRRCSPGLVFADDGALFGRALVACRQRHDLIVTCLRPGSSQTLDSRAEPTRRPPRGRGACSCRTPTPSRRSCSPRARPAHRKASSTPSGCCAPIRRCCARAAVPRRRAAGAVRLAAVEPHLRRQSQLRPRALQRRHALYRRRPPDAGASRRRSRNLSEIATDRVLQRAARLRAAACQHLCADAGLPRPLLQPAADAVLRRGGAAPARRRRSRQLAAKPRGDALPLVSGLGATETAPLAICAGNAASPADVSACLRRRRTEAGAVRRTAEGAAARPECHARLLARRRPYRAAFDEEGFYSSATRLSFFDPRDPSLGIAFDGRIAEDFKLSTGTGSGRSAPCELLAHFGDSSTTS